MSARGHAQKSREASVAKTITTDDSWRFTHSNLSSLKCYADGQDDCFQVKYKMRKLSKTLKMRSQLSAYRCDQIVHSFAYSLACNAAHWVTVERMRHFTLRMQSKLSTWWVAVMIGRTSWWKDQLHFDNSLRAVTHARPGWLYSPREMQPKQTIFKIA